MSILVNDQLELCLRAYDWEGARQLLARGASPVDTWGSRRMGTYDPSVLTRIAIHPVKSEAPQYAKALELLCSHAKTHFSHCAQPVLDDALLLASGPNNAWAVEVLLRYGANFNATIEDEFILSHAASTGAKECLALLIQAGGKLSLRDVAGRGPLEKAIESGRYALSQWLVEQGALIKCSGAYGEYSPALIALATRENNWGLVEERRELGRFLLTHGAPLEGISPAWGLNPLGVAVQGGERYRVAAEILLDLGVDPRSRANHRQSALEMAYAFNSPLLSLLESRVATIELQAQVQVAAPGARRRLGSP